MIIKTNVFVITFLANIFYFKFSKNQVLFLIYMYTKLFDVFVYIYYNNINKQCQKVK